MFIYCITIFIFNNAVYSLEFKEERDDNWVSPKKLFQDNYYSVSKNDENMDLRKDYTLCKLALQKCNSDCNPSNTELQFFNRFVLSITKKFPILKSENQAKNGHYTCDINLSHSNFNYLVEPFDKSSSTEKLFILENLFTNINWNENYVINSSLFTEHNLEMLKIFVLMIVTAFIFLKIMQTFYMMNLSFYKIIIISFLLIFTISVPWTWWHLYQKAKSKKIAEIYKGIPDSCNSQNFNIWSSITNLFYFKRDECSEYFEKTEVHPFLEVTPTMALSITITRFLLEPAEYIGDAIRRFITATFQDLPIYLYLPVVFFMLIIFLTLMFTWNGYRIRSILFSIEPAPNTGNFTKEIEKLKIENKQLQEKLLKINKDVIKNPIESGSGECPLSLNEFL